MDATAVALGEMQTLADAETWAAIDTKYYVSLENLNDIALDGYLPEYDFIGDGGGTPVIEPAKARFLTSRVDLTHGFWPWLGPYVNYQPGKTDSGNLYGFDVGTPLDPWGGLYYFFTPAGLVKPPMGITLDYYGDDFSQYAIVSFGPNAKFGGGDDLIYFFGSPPTARIVTSVRPDRARFGETVSIKGYNFGTMGGGVQLLFNGAPVTGGITSWTARLIQKQILASDPVGTVYVTVAQGVNVTTPPVILTIKSNYGSAADWVLY